ncbi:MAG TPA: iron-containing alcohol dehydrogenase [Methylomirabilota bacterium]|nr:iron-containing alcohol dehydrogenase [Methylomirabilota bacterium]
MPPSWAPFTWFHPTRIVFGVGALSRLPSVIDDAGEPGARVFLVTGRQSLRARGVLDRVLEAVGPRRITLFDAVPPFPAPGVVDTAVDACRRGAAEVIVGIGGGSALDVAKLVALLAIHPGTARDLAARLATIGQPGLPVVTVPTTSGSSSEVTPFATLWDMAGKRSIHHASTLLFPRAAIVDPDLAMAMPRRLAAVTGLDALTSAIESYWSREAAPVSDALALTAIRMLAENLESSCNGGDADARSACALAATVSGVAYTHSRPNVCHAVGSPLTLFWDVSHGQAVAITLPSFLRWTAPAIPEKLPALWRALGVSHLDDGVARLADLMERCGLDTRLRALGLGAPDVETVLEHTRWERVAMLPRPLGRDEARAILQALL